MLAYKASLYSSPFEFICTKRLFIFLCDEQSDDVWRSALHDNYESLEELLTVRIVIDYMKDRIARKHMEALGRMKKDWQKIEYLVRTVLIKEGSSELFDIFTQVIVLQVF